MESSLSPEQRDLLKWGRGLKEHADEEEDEQMRMHKYKVIGEKIMREAADVYGMTYADIWKVIVELFN